MSVNSYDAWKTAYLQQTWSVWRADQRAVAHQAIWTAFGAKGDEPLDIKVQWLADQQDNERLRAAVLRSLTAVARRGSALQLERGGRACSCLQFIYDARWYGNSGSATGPEGAPTSPEDVLARQALAQLGEETSSLLPTAIHAARLVDGRLESETTILDPSLGVAPVRSKFAGRLREATAREPLDAGDPEALEMLRTADGVITVGLTYPKPSELDRRRVGRKLLARALADLDR